VSKGGPQKSKRYELWGWILFTISALFFIVSSLRNGDIVGLLGGVFFLLACAAFLACYFAVHTGTDIESVGTGLPSGRISPSYASPWAASICLNTLSHNL
jgi:hypothetical protein